MKYYDNSEQHIVRQIQEHLSRYGKDRTYFDIAELYNFRPHKTRAKRRDDVRSIQRRMRNLGLPIGNGEPVQKWKTGFIYNDEDILSRKMANEFWNERELALLASNSNSVTVKEKLPINEVYEKYGHLPELQEFLKWKISKTSNQSIKKVLSRKNLPKPYKGNPNNVLAIGDLHEPFCLEGYLEFCREQQERFDCGKVVFIGDIIDSYYESFYDKAIDAPMTQQQERQEAIAKLKEWYDVFPEATVTVGNHTLRYYRKGSKYGIHESHFRPLDEILEAPKTWNFVNEIIIDKVLYRHGSTGHAFTNAQKERMSVVEGDKHTLGYVQWSSSRKDSIFGMQTGCVDADTEFLTPEGWKKISEYQNELVCQYHKDGTATFVKPNAYIKIPETKLYHIKNKYGLEMKLCANHDVVYRNRYSKQLSKIKTTELIEKHKRNKQGFANGIPCTFTLNNENTIDLAFSDDALRLQVAFMADGTIVGKKCVIQLKKDRKIKRLQKLIDNLKLPHNRSDYDNGIVRFKFTPPILNKFFDDSFWYNINKKQLEVIAHESLFWDGDQIKEFTSINKCDVDFIQFAFNSIGYRTYIRHDTRENKESYSVIISLKKKDRYIATKGDKDIFTEIDTVDGFKYCFNVPSGMLVLRCNNSIFITGNCGIDYKKFAFNYAKNTSKKPILGCGVILDRGQTPLFLKMKN